MINYNIIVLIVRYDRSSTDLLTQRDWYAKPQCDCLKRWNEKYDSNVELTFDRYQSVTMDEKKQPREKTLVVMYTVHVVIMPWIYVVLKVRMAQVIIIFIDIYLYNIIVFEQCIIIISVIWRSLIVSILFNRRLVHTYTPRVHVHAETISLHPCNRRDYVLWLYSLYSITEKLINYWSVLFYFSFRRIMQIRRIARIIAQLKIWLKQLHRCRNDFDAVTARCNVSRKR